MPPGTLSNSRKFHILVEKVPKPRIKPDIWERPLTRALGAFMLTTVLGTILTTCWQTRQWREQQIYTARVDRAKIQMQIAKSVTERLNDAFSCSNHVVFMTLLDAQGNAATIRDEQLRSSVEEWMRQDRTWRVSESVLLADTTAQFTRPDVSRLLTQALENRRQLFKKILEFIEISHAEPVPSKGDPHRKQLEDINAEIYLLVHNTTGRGMVLPQLTQAMISEMREDQASRESLWDRL